MLFVRKIAFKNTLVHYGFLKKQTKKTAKYNTDLVDAYLLKYFIIKRPYGPLAAPEYERGRQIQDWLNKKYMFHCYLTAYV